MLHLHSHNSITANPIERLVPAMKKMICLLLCLMMIIPAAVSRATETINSISVTLKLPLPGTIANMTPSVTVPAGAPYEYSTEESRWYIGEGSGYMGYDFMPLNAVFEATKTYYAGIVVRPMEGYMFSSDAAVSCTNGTAIKKKNIPGAYASFIVEFTVPKAEKVSLKKLKISKLSSPSKTKIKVFWKKLTSAQKKKIKKIEIQVSADKGFKKSVITKRVSSGKSSCTVKGLKKNRKYYVRIRAYTEEKTVINVSKWSAKKSIKTKK